MTEALSPAAATCLAALEAALRGGPRPDLAGLGQAPFDEALRALTRIHGPVAAPLLRALAGDARARDLRRPIRRALYRLGDRSEASAPEAARPVVTRDPVRAVRAWVSGIDGAGSRAVWIVFEGGLGGGQSLCSLIINDEAGILEAAGGAITRKRLDAELAKLYRDQKLPWVETSAARVCALVREALASHQRARTDPPVAYARWAPFFAAIPPGEDGGPLAAAPDPLLVERSAELLDLPELAGWFADPAAIAEDAVSLLEMRDSRLVIPDQVKVEREAAIVGNAVDRAFSAEARPRWAHRLLEMSLVFRATGREEAAQIAAATAVAVRDPERALSGVPWAAAMARRGLEVAGDVALGRVRLGDVRRSPVAAGPTGPAGPSGPSDPPRSPAPPGLL
jgi:hypothetical protein